MKLSDLVQIPNLLSLVRIFLLPVIGYYVAQGDGISGLIALGFLILAGITDGLDGYFARRLNQVTKLGLILDPLADKVLAAGLVILLIFYRDFPIWLAGVIVGRDVLLLLVGLMMMRKSDAVPSSNMTGKYAYFSIIVMLSCYLIRFVFGIWLFSMITIILLGASTALYAKRILAHRAGRTPGEFKDSTSLQVLRALTIAATAILTFYYLYFHLVYLLSN